MPYKIDTIETKTINATESITLNGAPVGKNPISSVFIDTTLFTSFLPNGESTLESVFFGYYEVPYSIIKLSDGSFLTTDYNLKA